MLWWEGDGRFRDSPGPASPSLRVSQSLGLLRVGDYLGSPLVLTVSARCHRSSVFTAVFSGGARKHTDGVGGGGDSTFARAVQVPAHGGAS